MSAQFKNPVHKPSRSVSHILVIVGTDHHPFDRLINWTNEWLRRHPQQSHCVFAQWGSASARPTCPGAQFLEVNDLVDRLDQADIIVCHGGPNTIAEAWARGRMPIVVPRLAKLGEHVDDHQAEFCERFEALGRIALARSLADFTRLLAEAETEPLRFRTTNSGSTVDQAVVRLGRLVEELVSRPRRPLLISKRHWFRIVGKPADHDITLSDPNPIVGTAWQAEPRNSGPTPRCNLNEEYE